jgi:GTP-binding protein
VVATKIDALDDPARLSHLKAHVQARGLECLPVSAVTGEGVDALLERIWRFVADARDAGARQTARTEPASAG